MKLHILNYKDARGKSSTSYTKNFNLYETKKVLITCIVRRSKKIHAFSK